MRILALLALLPLLAACDTADPDPPDPLGPPTPIDETTLVTETTEAALAQRRTQWAEEGPDDYRFSIYRLCICLESRVRYVVTVRDGRATEATRMPPNDSTAVPVDPASVPYPTVASLFDEIQAGFDAEADEVEVGYRTSDGLPAEIFIDFEAGRADDELILFVAGFDAL